MLDIKKLRVSVGGSKLLTGIDLSIKPGEIHVVMGPNGSGKSTLANVLIGRESYSVTAGTMTFDGHDLSRLSPEERARHGIFLAFQNPVAIPGVTIATFLKASLDAIREARGLGRLEPIEALNMIRKHAVTVGLNAEVLRRAVNDGFSGGEKKRFELLQLLVLEPALVILDEVDSGLDRDGLKLVGKLISKLKTKKRSFLIITHYNQILDVIKPTKVHVMMGGKIVKSGGLALAHQIEKNGYDRIKKTTK